VSNDLEVLEHLQRIQRDVAEINRRTIIIIRFLVGALAALLAIGTYVAVESWGFDEFWMRSSAITVLVISYLILDRQFCHPEREQRPLSLLGRSLKVFQHDEQRKAIFLADEQGGRQALRVHAQE
jgi:hypothetical protein